MNEECGLGTKIGPDLFKVALDFFYDLTYRYIPICKVFNKYIIEKYFMVYETVATSKRI